MAKEITDHTDHTEDSTDPTEGTPNPTEDRNGVTNGERSPIGDTEGEGEGDEGKPDTFPRSYVERLRQEAADHRTRAKDRDTLAAALWTAQVAALGKLADPSDLPMPADADVFDADAIAVTVDELLARKPYMGSRQPRGDVGQGATGGDSGTVDLLGMLRSRA